MFICFVEKSAFISIDYTFYSVSLQTCLPQFVGEWSEFFNDNEVYIWSWKEMGNSLTVFLLHFWRQFVSLASIPWALPGLWLWLGWLMNTTKELSFCFAIWFFSSYSCCSLVICVCKMLWGSMQSALPIFSMAFQMSLQPVMYATIASLRIPMSPASQSVTNNGTGTAAHCIFIQYLYTTSSESMQKMYKELCSLQARAGNCWSYISCSYMNQDLILMLKPEHRWP